MENIRREIETDLYPLFHKLDLYGADENVLNQINEYLERGVTSFGSKIPEQAKLNVLNGVW